MRRSLIIATSENGVIGSNGQIPWKLPNDMKRFKQLTMGHCLIMGRKTHVSVGKPLPGRMTIVLSRGGSVIPFAPLVRVADSLQSAISTAAAEHDDEVFICGGGEIYREAIGWCLVDRVYRTVIEQRFDGDTTFVMDFAHFKRAEVEHVEGAGLPHRFEIWERV